MSQVIEPQIVEFGPYRVIGMSNRSKNENGEFTALWASENGFLARMGEVEALEGIGCFGICRCVPGVTDGSFEYIAALPAKADAVVPDGMIEAGIGKSAYAVFTVNGLAEIMQGWEAAYKWVVESSEWESYCGNGSCDCADYPGFELYPPEFGVDGKLFVYIPIRVRA